MSSRKLVFVGLVLVAGLAPSLSQAAGLSFSRASSLAYQAVAHGGGLDSGMDMEYAVQQAYLQKIRTVRQGVAICNASIQEDRRVYCVNKMIRYIEWVKFYMSPDATHDRGGWM